MEKLKFSRERSSGGDAMFRGAGNTTEHLIELVNANSVGTIKLVTGSVKHSNRLSRVESDLSVVGKIMASQS